MGSLVSRQSWGALCAVFLGALLATQNVGCASYSTGRYHSLAKGENLYQLSRRYNVPVSALVKANRIDDVSALQVGEAIWIPRGRSGAGGQDSSRAARAAAPAKGSGIFENGNL